MTVLNTGSTKKYSASWENIFGATTMKKTAAPKAAKKSAKKTTVARSAKKPIKKKAGKK